MKFIIDLNEKSIPLEIQSGKEGYTVQLESGYEDVDVQTIGTNLFHIILYHKSFILRLEESVSGFTIYVNQKKYPLTLKDETQILLEKMGFATQEESHENEIRATIPGLVRKLEVSPGQKIQKGDGLLILEAMKMENEIKSSANGTITAIHIQEGQTIEKDYLMMEIEKE